MSHFYNISWLELVTLIDFVTTEDVNETKAKQQALGEGIMFIVNLSCNGNSKKEKRKKKNLWLSGIQRQQLAGKIGLEAAPIV